MTESFVQAKEHARVSFDKHFSTSIANNYFLCYDTTVLSLHLMTFLKSLRYLNYHSYGWG